LTDRPAGLDDSAVGQALLFAVVAVAVLLVLAAAYLFNGLVRRRNRVDATWSDVEVLLKRRHDLVPNLVSSVQGYAAHESATFQAVAAARTAAISASGPQSAGAAEAQLTQGVKSLFAVAEAYPQLKASSAFVALQRKLTETEDGLEHARQFYNDAVYGYNNAAQTLPGALVAGPLGFRTRQFFQASPAEQAAVVARP
jgi:LemA protein